MSKLHVPELPCSSCPYRKDTPSGVWHYDEYEKLRAYDIEYAKTGWLSTFLCHHSLDTEQDTVCRGWLSVHCDSIAVRLAILRGAVTAEEAYAHVSVDLYASGNEAADAGQKNIEQPDEKARRIVEKLSKNEKRRSD